MTAGITTRCFPTGKLKSTAAKQSTSDYFRVGSLVLFIPPWAPAILHPDAAAAYPDLGNEAGDAVYLVFTRNAMPIGTMGLLLAGLFAASMSSMDSALYKNAGIFVRSVYQPFLHRRNIHKDERHLLNISRFLSTSAVTKRNKGALDRAITHNARCGATPHLTYCC